jgi:uncharacterized protein YdeI (YjbR/CyaY-like superfamily)
MGDAAMETKQGLPVVPFGSQGEWEAWLAANHATAKGLWVKIAKLGTGVASVTYDQALEGALCYGWIDGQKAPYDDRFWLQRLTPRGKKSKWSRINRDKAARLLAQGRMAPAGRAQVEAAQADGRWEAAYEGQGTMEVPDDLQAELDKDAGAAAFFASLSSRNRYAILYRLHDAKKPETRARRLEQFVTMLRERRKVYP